MKETRVLHYQISVWQALVLTAARKKIINQIFIIKIKTLKEKLEHKNGFISQKHATKYRNVLQPFSPIPKRKASRC